MTPAPYFPQREPSSTAVPASSTPSPFPQLAPGALRSSLLTPGVQLRTPQFSAGLWSPDFGDEDLGGQA